MEEVLQQTYERLVHNAVELLHNNQSTSGPAVIATMSCIGYAGGGALTATVLANPEDAVMPLVMALSVIRACCDTEKLAPTKAALKQIDELLTIAIRLKVGAAEPVTLLH
ncbi:hypothetical protein [Burkholderia cenocepacia]|uniref:hypothetical protein n=1 Tax=Burkholderia cenocepacia TaxID=95486 RepID=UPI00076149CA|nr:hypothetical protein [Burkholderia cenocepacia]KWU17878.1 hypothetical protein AS149_14470 [Burkholderia cenocepacia]